MQLKYLQYTTDNKRYNTVVQGAWKYFANYYSNRESHMLGSVTQLQKSKQNRKLGKLDYPRVSTTHYFVEAVASCIRVKTFHKSY